MKKSILNLGKALNKAEQKQVNGGSSCPGPICYGIPGMGCGTCEQYHALPDNCKMRVLVSVNCFGI
ncbi:conserved protein of unknown function [Tenacibaculum sp. 190130A14a]|uniref:Bacteriocin n=1 Tax=Tenacibaculum polynesiense TaxID=3137857 RepID=A0ABP1F2H1_9FLAO